MALSKPKEKAPAQAPGKFEEPDNVQAATATAPAPAPKPVQDPVAAAGVAASTAVARVAAGSLAAAMKTENLLSQMQDAIPPVAFGTFPRLIGANGAVCVKTDNSRNLGEFVNLKLLSWSETYVVSPGSDSAEAKELVRYSRDGVTIDDSGESVAAYLERLRTVEGFKDANRKKYIELIGILQHAAKPGGPIDEIVQVSLSPQSLLTFERYRFNIGVKQRLGQITGEGVENIRVTAEGKSGNGRNWTILTVTGQSAQ